MAHYPNIVPLGRITVIAVGTTTLLSVNCGPKSGSVVGTTISPPRPGFAFRQIRLAADKANTGQVFLLPLGKTAAANPDTIIAVIGPGQQVSIPDGVLSASGFVPENFCLDTDLGGSVIYGCAVLG
jgi:hypothetical protein